jgi:hypothetical protein
MSEVDHDKLNALVGKMLGDLGGAFSVPTVRIGYRVGLFEALHKGGAATAAELAKRTGLAVRYVREWALAQAANGYVAFNAADERFSLTPEQAMVFTVKDSPVYLEGAFDLSAAMVEGQPEGGGLPTRAPCNGRPIQHGVGSKTMSGTFSDRSAVPGTACPGPTNS